MLIDCSYFTKGSRLILNATTAQSVPDVNSRAVNEAIMGFIEEYQEGYLRDMVGTALGNKLHTYLISLEDGGAHIADFDEICDRLRESFAYYVFYHILRDTASEADITGLVRIKTANIPVSPIRRQVSAWNMMADKNRNFRDWVLSKECPVKGISISEEMTTYINSLNL